MSRQPFRLDESYTFTGGYACGAGQVQSRLHRRPPYARKVLADVFYDPALALAGVEPKALPRFADRQRRREKAPPQA
jgi:hypothetical protein